MDASAKVAPTRALGERIKGVRPKPMTVAVMPPVVGPFARTTEQGAGATAVKARESVTVEEAAVTLAPIKTPKREGVRAFKQVSDIHPAVIRAVLPIWPRGEMFTLPPPMKRPVKVTDWLEVVGAFKAETLLSTTASKLATVVMVAE